MDFARQQRDPTRHVIGMTVVVLLHVLVIYGLATGLARKAVEVIKKPLTATIVQEIEAPPPPPPPPKKIEIPKIAPPPQQVYVPPPDVPMPTVQSEPVIAAVTPTPPPEPSVIAPPAPPRSPIMHAHKTKTPTLNICGALDRCTPPEEAVQFHKALVENQVTSVLVNYPEEGHGVRKFPAAIDYTPGVVAWFEEYMPAKGSYMSKVKKTAKARN